MDLSLYWTVLCNYKSERLNQKKKKKTQIKKNVKTKSTIANAQDWSFVHVVHITCIAGMSDNIRCIYRRFNHCKLLTCIAGMSDNIRCIYSLCKLLNTSTLNLSIETESRSPPLKCIPTGHTTVTSRLVTNTVMQMTMVRFSGEKAH